MVTEWHSLRIRLQRKTESRKRDRIIICGKKQFYNNIKQFFSSDLNHTKPSFFSIKSFIGIKINVHVI